LDAVALTDLTFTPLSSATSIRPSSDPPLRLDDAVDAEVARMWRSGAAKGLTDGLVLRVVKQNDVFESSPLPYRYFWAQRLDPDLFATPLTSLAVTGVTWCEDHLLLGRRADWVLQDANCLELVPSGSADAGGGDLFAQIDREMTEELGISSSTVTAHRLLGIVEDELNKVVEAVIETKLTCSFAEVRQSHARIERPEYSELFALTATELAAAIDRGSDPISAVSRTIFAHAIQEA
jgi:hypothetical protein